MTRLANWLNEWISEWVDWLSSMSVRSKSSISVYSAVIRGVTKKSTKDLEEKGKLEFFILCLFSFSFFFYINSISVVWELVRENILGLILISRYLLTSSEVVYCQSLQKLDFCSLGDTRFSNLACLRKKKNF